MFADCTFGPEPERVPTVAKQAGSPTTCTRPRAAFAGGLQQRRLPGRRALFNPGHPCGESKALAERDIAELADDSFSSTYLRTATAYRVSPRLRGDVVVNNLAEWPLPPARCI